MAESDERPPIVGLDYAAPERKAASRSVGAIVLSVICLGIGVLFCSVGVGMLIFVARSDFTWGVSITQDTDFGPSLGFIVWGSILCIAGMRLKRRKSVEISGE